MVPSKVPLNLYLQVFFVFLFLSGVGVARGREEETRQGDEVAGDKLHHDCDDFVAFFFLVRHCGKLYSIQSKCPWMDIGRYFVKWS